MHRMTWRAIALIIISASVATAAERANDIDLSIVPPDKFTGEPYQLAGKRIVFTNWYYVRPGGYAWKDEKGEVVTVTRARFVADDRDRVLERAAG